MKQAPTVWNFPDYRGLFMLWKSFRVDFLYTSQIIDLEIFRQFIRKSQQKFCCGIIQIYFGNVTDLFHSIGKEISVNTQDIGSFFVIMKTLKVYLKGMIKFIPRFLIVFPQTVQGGMNKFYKFLWLIKFIHSGKDQRDSDIQMEILHSF